MQLVTSNEANSTLAPGSPSVPQESVLGPLLFLICVYDLPSRVPPKICFFDGECVIYGHMNDYTGIRILLSDITVISTCCDASYVERNSATCKLISCVNNSQCNIQDALHHKQTIVLESIFMLSCTERGVMSTFFNLKSSNSIDINGVPIKPVKVVVDLIPPILVNTAMR